MPTKYLSNMSMGATCNLSACSDSDTLIVRKNVSNLLSDTIDGRSELECFLVNGDRVSFFSCLFFSHGGEIEAIRLMVSTNKSSLMSTEELSDTMIIDDLLRGKAFFPLSYSQQIKALDMILKDIAMNYSFKRNVTLILNIGDWGDETVNITKSYNNLPGNKKNNNAFREVIWKSSLYRDVSRLLSDYSFSVIDIEIEKMYKISCEIFIKSNLVNQDVPQSVYSTTLYLKCKR